MNEDQIQIAVADRLRALAMPGVLWWHTPNGGKRHPGTAARLKRMGTLPGVPDLLLFNSAGEKFALELKAAKGRPTESQLEFLDRWRATGGHGITVNGLDAAIACLEAWNLIRRSA